MNFEVSRKLMKAIGTLIQITRFPFCDEEVVKRLVNWFRGLVIPIPVDGIADTQDEIEIAIRKPPDEYVLRNLYSQKCVFALPVQVVADSGLRFRHMPRRCTESTFDPAAFDVSELAYSLRRN